MNVFVSKYSRKYFFSSQVSAPRKGDCFKCRSSAMNTFLYIANHFLIIIIYFVNIYSFSKINVNSDAKNVCLAIPICNNAVTCKRPVSGLSHIEIKIRLGDSICLSVLQERCCGYLYVIIYTKNSYMYLSQN